MSNMPKTPGRSIRISDELWEASQAYAALHGTNVTQLVVSHLESLTGHGSNAQNPEALILAAYQKLTSRPREWTRLVELREIIGDAAPRETIDAAIRALSKDDRVQLAPDSNRKALTQADHAAAIRIGGEDKHLLAFETS